MLKFMYITNQPAVAKIVEDAGVERIFVDMEYIGKADRQGGMDTVQCHHTPDDIRAIKQVLTSSKIMARCNPIHSKSKQYGSSKEEIDAAIEAGADILMLPYFKTVEEVKEFVTLVDGRAKTLPLVETPEAVACIDEILEIDGIDEIFIGLNDLSLGYGMKFMFQLLTDGTVENLCKKFKKKGIPYGFGGIAALGQGLIPAERVIAEHYRLGSTCAILSRSFCDTGKIKDIKDVQWIFQSGLKELRLWEGKCESGKIDFTKNREELEKAVARVLNNIS